jgi:hypothetical protein
MYSYIGMTFGVGWEPHMCDLPRFCLTALKPWSHTKSVKKTATSSSTGTSGGNKKFCHDEAM